jgi:hypothetical protein
MHASSANRIARVFLIAALAAGALAVLPQGARAQPAAVQTAQLATQTQQLQPPLSPGFDQGKVPMLYEGELEDLGPQYLLVQKPKHKWFTASLDWQTYYTNNAALAPNNRGASDISVVTAQLMAQAVAYNIGDLQVQPRAGFRYQAYWYGVLSGRGHLVGGVPVKYSDFMTYTPFVEALYQYGNFLGSTGVRYSAFTNDTKISQGTFYQEWAPYWLFGYQWQVTKSQMLLVQYDGDFRFSNTANPTGLLTTGINDRTDNAVSVVYNYILGGKWAFQPTYRYQWSYYTDSKSNPNPGEGRRNDTYNTASLVVAYYFTDWCSARVFTSYEWRSSSAAGNNYQVANAGAGASLNYTF